MYNLLRRLAVKIIISKEANLVDRVYGKEICFLLSSAKSEFEGEVCTARSGASLLGEIR